MERAALEGERIAFGPFDGARAGKFDPANGADFRNFPPNPLVNYRGMLLRMNVPDLNQPAFSAVQELRVEPIGVPVTSLSLNAEGLSVSKVRVDGKDAEYSYDGHVLAIRFATPLAPGETVIETTYECKSPTRGMTFSCATPEIPGVAKARKAELHTQGETETNRHWFPIHDFPNIRIPTELIVTVPKSVMVSSNGALVEHTSQADREIWHWKQEKAHVPYLVSVVAGEFERVTLPNPKSGVPMSVWLAPGRADDARATYANTDAMIVMFEKRFGVKYPWARYDQLLVRNFGAGGMENTSATSMHPSAVFDAVARKEQDLDGLISHELCHQWTGDLITCRSWEHIWLNEGWATYGSALWQEERDGPDGYYDSVLGSAGVARRDTNDAPQPMCSPIYENAGETFGRPANPYPKGASILHMLRRMLGDEVFDKGVHLYMNRHAGGLAETSDFRRAMEEASGLSLEWFFDQWCYRPGSPRVQATASYDAGSRTLNVTAEQTQKIDARTPALRISIPVWIRTAGGERVVPFEMRARTGQIQVQLDGPPQAVWVDPWLEALKTIEVTQAEEWTLETLRSGPTIAAKRQALATLGLVETPAARDAMVKIAQDARARHTLRAAAVETLSEYRSPESKTAVLTLLNTAADDPRVTAAIVTALRTCTAGDAVPKLCALLEPAEKGGTASYVVRSAAIGSLIALDAKECLPLLRVQVSVPSHAEGVSQAALKALAKWGTAQDVPLVQSRTALGIADRARPEAVETLAAMCPRLDAATKAAVEQFVLALLEDSENRTANAAGDALAAMKCKDALPRLKAIAERDRDPARKTRAERWVKAIQEEGKVTPAG